MELERKFDHKLTVTSTKMDKYFIIVHLSYKKETRLQQFCRS